MGINVDVTQVVSGLYKFRIFARKRIREYLEHESSELVSYMKFKAAWQDRTGDARRGLGSDVIESEDVIGLSLYHTVYYGVYLEYAMELRFAILEPTARLKGPEVIRGMEGILNRGVL